MSGRGEEAFNIKIIIGPWSETTSVIKWIGGSLGTCVTDLCGLNEL